MKKIKSTLSILIIGLFFCTQTTFANNSLSLSVNNPVQPNDTTEITLLLSNSDAVVAFQTDIYLGYRFSYIPNSCQLTERGENHQVSASMVNGNLRIISYSETMSAYSGNSGALLTFKLKTGVISQSIYPFNSTLSDSTGQSLNVSNYHSNITIDGSKLLVNSSNIYYGTIPIGSTYTKNIQIRNTGSSSLEITDVNFSSNDFEITNTFPIVVSQGSYTFLDIEYTPTHAGEIIETLNFISNSITAEPTVTLYANTYSVNELHVMDKLGYCDSIISIALTMNNMDSIVGFQSKFDLSSTFEYIEGSFQLTSRKSDHITSASVIGDSLLLIAYSPTNLAFSGIDDTIATFSVKLKSSHGVYELCPQQTILANKQGENRLSAYYCGNITIRSPKIYCEQDLFMDTTSVIDTASANFTIYNNGNAPLIINNVVFSQLGYSITESLPITIPDSSNKTIQIKYAGTNEGNFSAYMKLYSNDPTNGLQNVMVTGNRYEPNTLTISATYNPELNNAQISVSMDNYTNITAAQFDFIYPNLQFETSQANFNLSERTTNHQLSVFSINDSVWRVLIYSLQNNIISNNIGEIINITLSPSTDIALNTYCVSLNNIVLSDIYSVNKYSDSLLPSDCFSICQNDTTYIYDSICQGNNYDNNGFAISADNINSEIFTTTNIFTNISGCDSLVILTLNIKETPTITISGNDVITFGENTVLTAEGANSYTWNTGETTSSITVEPDSTSLFFVEGINSNGCISTDSITVIVLTNLSEDSFEKIKLYPNPGRNIINIQYENNHYQITNIEIFDINERKVLFGKNKQLSNNSIQIDISELNSGSYFMRIQTTENKVISKKMIIE